MRKQFDKASSRRSLSTEELATITGGTGTPKVTYQKIETIWKEGNISGTDDWQKV